MPDPKPGTWRHVEMRGVQGVILDMCAEFNVSVNEVLGGWGSRSATKAKQKAAYLLRQRGLTWSEVGKILGRSPATVLKAAGRYERGLSE